MSARAALGVGRGVAAYRDPEEKVKLIDIVTSPQ